MIVFRPQARFDKESVMILLTQESIKKREYPFLEPQLRKKIDSLTQSNQLIGENGEIFPLVFKKQLILLVGLGSYETLSLTALRKIVRRAFLSPYLKKVKNVEFIIHDPQEDYVKAIIEAFLIGRYTWKKYKSPNKKDQTIEDKTLFLAVRQKKDYADTIQICQGTNFARDLVNDNADAITSRFFEQTVRGLIKGKKNVTLEVLNERAMRSKGLNLFLAVNQGSLNEPKLIIVRYSGASKKEKYTAVVGKGMTFDTGGLNLKPSGHIETMRMDMAGAAAIAGILKNVVSLQLGKNIIFAFALAENATGAGSYKPGDVIKSYSGKTVEIANTDAEGRLILADTVSYLVKNYQPFRIIDIATLTGACIVALGYDYTGLMTPDEEFARKLIQSANETDDRVWRLPLYTELKDSVKSKIADIQNLSTHKRAAGTISAAEFIHQFTDGTPWAHLDIAGTAFVEGEERMYFSYGATGAGVRLLTHFLQNY